LKIDAAGSGGGGGGGSTQYLNDLLDVETSTKANEQFLAYENATGLWKNNSVLDGGTF
jgi:hypothetical protein